MCPQSHLGRAVLSDAGYRVQSEAKSGFVVGGVDDGENIVAV